VTSVEFAFLPRSVTFCENVQESSGAMAFQHSERARDCCGCVGMEHRILFFSASHALSDAIDGEYYYSQIRISLVHRADSTARELYFEEALPEQHQHLSAPISAVGVGLFY